MTRAADAGVVETITAIWTEHLDVARALLTLATDVAAATDIIEVALARGGQLLIAHRGGTDRAFSEGAGTAAGHCPTHERISPYGHQQRLRL